MFGCAKTLLTCLFPVQIWPCCCWTDVSDAVRRRGHEDTAEHGDENGDHTEVARSNGLGHGIGEMLILHVLEADTGQEAPLSAGRNSNIRVSGKNRPNFLRKLQNFHLNFLELAWSHLMQRAKPVSKGTHCSWKGID